MGVVKNMMVRAGADFSAITTQSKKASTSVKGMQSSVSKSFGIIKQAASGVGRMMSDLGISVSLTAAISAARDAAEAYDAQAEAEMKLAGIMRNTMGARNTEIQSVLNLCSAQQKLGVVGDEMQIAGAQQMAGFLSTSAALKTLIPAMNNLAVQQHGYNVTAQDTSAIATMLGKVMAGQTGAMRRYGYTFTEAEEAIMKYGSEEERAATLARVVEQRVGGMNQALASTPTGRMQQLSNALGDIKEQFGACARAVGTLLLPLFWRVVEILQSVTAWANRAVNSIGRVFGTGELLTDWTSISTGVSDYGDAWDDVTDEITGAGKAAAKAKGALMGFDELNILSTSDASSEVTSTSVAQGAETGAGGALETIQNDVGDEDVPWLTRALEKIIDHLGLIKGAALGVGAALLTWKFIGGLGLGFSTVLGIVLAVAGAVALVSGVIDAWNNGVSMDNVISMLGGTAVAAVGLGLAFGAVGAAIALVVGGAAALVVGMHDWITTGELSTETFFLLEGGIVAVGAGLALLLGPIALVVAAVAAAALAVYKYWDEICVWWQQTCNTIAGIASKAWRKITEWWRNTCNTIAGIVRTVWNRISGFWDSIRTSVRQGAENVWQGILDIGSRIGDFFRDLPSRALEWGRDLINGLIDGIRSKINGIIDACRSIGESIRSYLHFSTPDEGPLKDYESWMPDMVHGLADRLRGSKGLLRDAASEAAGEISTALHDSVDPSIAFANGNHAFWRPQSGAGPDRVLATFGAELGRAVGDRASSQPITTIFKVGEREFARATYDANQAIKREKGFSLISNFA